MYLGIHVVPSHHTEIVKIDEIVLNRNIGHILIIVTCLLIQTDARDRGIDSHDVNIVCPIKSVPTRESSNLSQTNGNKCLTQHIYCSQVNTTTNSAIIFNLHPIHLPMKNTESFIQTSQINTIGNCPDILSALYNHALMIFTSHTLWSDAWLFLYRSMWEWRHGIVIAMSSHAGPICMKTE